MTTEKPDEPAIYHLRLRGRVDTQWSAWFDLAITLDEDGTTVLDGSIGGQTAFHSIVTRIRDLGLLLISMDRIDLDQAASQRKDTP